MVGKGNKLIPSLRPVEFVRRVEVVEVACGLLKRFKFPSTPSTSSTSLPSKILMEIRNRFNSLVEIEQVVFLVG
jgi:hypothetical protein